MSMCEKKIVHRESPFLPVRSPSMISLPAGLPFPHRGPAMRIAFGLAVVFSSAAFGDAPKMAPPASRSVDLGKDAWPIITERCILCHNGDKQKGAFRLTDGESLLRVGKV